MSEFFVNVYRASTGSKATNRWSLSLAVVLAVFSFLIYACTILTLPQIRNASACCEASGISAAISNVMYGAPLGSMYSGVYRYFSDRLDEPFSQAIEEARTPGTGLPAAPPGALILTTTDGNGIGYPLFATAAFRLFGIHAWALKLSMLLLMAFSAAAFIWRFHSTAFAGVVTLYFAALTVMLFTILVREPLVASFVPVGGVRYFSLVSVLPVFHILLSLFDPCPPQRDAAIRDGVLLALQMAILLLVVLARGTALPQIAAIALVGLALAWRRRRSPDRLRALLGQLAAMGAVSVAGLSVIALAVPRDYLTEERFGPTVWERVIAGLGTNPAWPFDGVNDMFDCKKFIPAGLQHGTKDHNAHCIWFDYLARHNPPIETSKEEINGGRYEAVLRDAFFEIAARYPGDMLKTFFYYKPRAIVLIIPRSIGFKFDGDRPPALAPVAPYPRVAYVPLFLSLTGVLIHFAIGTVSTTELRRVAGVTLLSTLFTLPAYFVAWAAPHTSADFLLYCLLGLGLAFGAIVIRVRHALWPAAHVSENVPENVPETGGPLPETTRA
jgi:hypothetical protein